MLLKQKKMLTVIRVLCLGSAILNLTVGWNGYWHSILHSALICLASWIVIPEGWYLLLASLIAQSIFDLGGDIFNNWMLGKYLVLRFNYQSWFALPAVIMAVLVYFSKGIFLSNKNIIHWRKVMVIVFALVFPFLPIIQQVAMGETNPTIFNYSIPVQQITFNVDGILGAQAREVVLRDIKSGKVTTFIPRGVPHLMCFSPDKKYLALGRGLSYKDKERDNVCIDLWDLQTKQLILLTRSIPIDKERGTPEVQVVAFSPDSKKLATGTGGGQGIVEIWDVSTGSLEKTINIGKTIRPLTGHLSSIYTLVYSPDGKYLAAGGIDGTDGIVSIWNVETGEVSQFLTTGKHGNIVELKYSPDGQYLASAINLFIPPLRGNSEKGEVEIWNPHTGELVKILTWEEDTRIRSLAFSPDGKSLVSGGESGGVRLWDISSGQNIKSYLDHPSALIQSVAYSPDGKVLAAAGNDKVKIWNINN